MFPLIYLRYGHPSFSHTLLIFFLNFQGPYIGFGGAAWNFRPTAQVLSTVLPFHYHHSDTRSQATIARHLGALKKAIYSLKNYYEIELPAIINSDNPSPPQAPYPYVTSFTSIEDSTTHKFAYLSQPSSEKLLFIGELEMGKRICVKFVKNYSDKVHSFCASMKVAPALIGFDRVPGGWHMVVMEALDEYQDLDTQTATHFVLDGIRAKIVLLHQAGYVHGDIRDTNVMVRRDGKKGFMLVDFDWAGKIGEVRYPMNVHWGDDLWRPREARDNKLIMSDHDLEMLEHMLESIRC